MSGTLKDMAEQPEREVPTLEPEQYPPFVVTEEERKRFDTAHAIAVDMFGDEGHEDAVWMTARSLYRSDIPT